MKKFCLMVVFISLICCNIVFAAVFSDYTDYINDIYEGGEPDYTDGDLEDKLCDSGYYADLFPEEVEDDYDDNDTYFYSYTYTPKKVDNSNLDMATRIKKASGRTSPRKYRGRWVKVNEHSIWSEKCNGTYRQDYEWKFYPEGSNQNLVLAWAIIDDKLYSFDRNGYMIHNTNDWLLSYVDSLYADKDGAFCNYADYQKNDGIASTYYKDVIPKHILKEINIGD